MAKHIVVSPFREINENKTATTKYDVGQDVSHLSEQRKKELLKKGLIEEKQFIAPAKSVDIDNENDNDN